MSASLVIVLAILLPVVALLAGMRGYKRGYQDGRAQGAWDTAASINTSRDAYAAATSPVATYPIYTSHPGPVAATMYLDGGAMRVEPAEQKEEPPEQPGSGRRAAPL